MSPYAYLQFDLLKVYRVEATLQKPLHTTKAKAKVKNKAKAKAKNQSINIHKSQYSQVTPNYQNIYKYSIIKSTSNSPLYPAPQIRLQ